LLQQREQHTFCIQETNRAEEKKEKSVTWNGGAVVHGGGVGVAAAGCGGG